jgi:hypothetical protein
MHALAKLLPYRLQCYPHAVGTSLAAKLEVAFARLGADVEKA